ncbi:MAG: hypothetical protein H5T86_13400, partial [Armatimonadetes bacterium]|nr:hypothetical protein [Armatimonadota bacterium]
MRFRAKYSEKDTGACGLIGWMSRSGRKIDGAAMIEAIAHMRERGNGLGGGFAAYGIYPDYADWYCFHIMYGSQLAREYTEELLQERFLIAYQEEIPTRHNPRIENEPDDLRRYFVRPHQVPEGIGEDEYVVRTVMDINVGIEDAFVFSSGKNMGAFKA